MNSKKCELDLYVVIIGFKSLILYAINELYECKTSNWAEKQVLFEVRAV